MKNHAHPSPGLFASRLSQQEFGPAPSEKRFEGLHARKLFLKTLLQKVAKIFVVVPKTNELEN